MLLFTLILIVLIGQQVRVYWQRLTGQLAPTLVRYLEESLDRSIRYDRWFEQRPGLVVLEGLRVMHDRAKVEREFLAIRRVEVEFDPGLLHWSSLATRGLGRNTAARIQASGVTITHPNGEVFLSAPRAATQLDLRPALSGQGDVLTTIAQVDVHQPKLRLQRRRDGRWNYQDLLRKKKDAKPLAFRGRILAQRAEIDFFDALAGRLPGVQRTRFAGTVDAGLAAYPSVYYHVAGRVSDGPVEVQPVRELTASGHADADTGELFVRASGVSENVQHWLNYASRARLPLEVVRGQARYEVVAWSPNRKAQPQFRVSATVDRGVVRAPDLKFPIEAVRGRLTADARAVTFDLDANVQGRAIEGAGEVVLRPEPVTRVRVASNELTLDWLKAVAPALRVPADLRLPRPVRASASLTGYRGQLVFRGRAATDTAEFRKDRAEGISAVFRGTFRQGGPTLVDGTLWAREGDGRGIALTRGQVDFRLRPEVVQLTARVDALGGEVAAKGWIDLVADPPEFQLHGTGTGLQPSLAPAKSENVRVTGSVTTEFVASGTFEEPHLSAYVDAAPLAVDTYSFDRLGARVEYHAGALQVSHAVVERRGQRVSASGTLSQKGELDFRLVGQGLAAAPLAAEYLEEPVEGQLYLAAHLTGTTEQPRIAGRVQVYHPRLPGRKEVDADYLSAAVEWTLRGPLTLRDVSAIRLPLRVSSPLVVLTPPAEGQKEWSIEAEASIEGLTAVHGLRLGGMSEESLRKLPLSGAFETLQVTARGPLNNLALTFDAKGSGFAAMGHDVGEIRARGSVALRDGVVKLDTLTAASQAQQVEASGEVRFSRAEPAAGEPSQPLQLSLRVGVEDLRLLPLVRRYAPQLLDSVTLEGTLRRADLQISGTSEAPQIQGQIAVGRLLVNGRLIRVEPFLVQVNRQVVAVREVETQLGSGTLSVPFLAALLGEQPASQQLLHRLVGKVVLDEIPVAVLEQLVQDSPRYRSKSLSALRDALDQWTTPVAGKVSATLTAAGSEGLPESLDAVADAIRSRKTNAAVTGEIQVPDLASPPDSDGPLTRVAARFRYVPGRLDVSEVTLNQEPDTSLSLSGYLVEPGKSSDGELSVTARGGGLKLASLARLPIRGLAQRLEPLQPLEGVGRFTATASGTVRSPHLTLDLDIDHPIIAGVPFDTLVVEGGEYSAKDALLKLTSARLTKALPGGEAESRVRIQGELPLTWPQLSIPIDRPRELTVMVPDQSLAVFKVLAADAEKLAQERGGENPGRMAPVIAVFQQIAATEGRMDARITLGGTREAPVNSGFFRLENATLRVDGLETEIQKFQARLDLEGDQLKLTRVEGEGSRGGGLRAEGLVQFGISPEGDFDPRLDLRLYVDRFKFVEKKVGSLLGEAFKGTQTNGVLQSVSSAAISQPAPLRITGDLKNPLIEGGLRLDDSSTLLAYDSAVPGKEAGEGGGPRIQLRFVVGNNVWLRNPQARLKLGGGVAVGNTVGAPVVTGDLLVQEGTIPLPGLRLRNVEGVLRINYDGRARELKPEGRSPVFVDLTAESSVRLQRTAAIEAEDYDLQLNIRGAPGGTGESGIRPAGVTGGLQLGGDSGLTITVRTDPPLPAGEIEALIRQHFGVEGFGGGGSNVVEALRSQIEQALAVNVSSALTGRIEDVLQSALGLSVFSIDLGVSQPLRIRLGKRLFGKLYGTVSQQFGSAEGDNPTRYEIYYRLTPRLRLGYRQEEPLGLRVIFVSGGASF